MPIFTRVCTLRRSGEEVTSDNNGPLKTVRPLECCSFSQIASTFSSTAKGNVTGEIFHYDQKPRVERHTMEHLGKAYRSMSNLKRRSQLTEREPASDVCGTSRSGSLR